MPALLETQDLYAGYGNKKVVRDVSLSVEAGHVTAVIGPNGSGKTTLLKGLMGALRLRGGTIRFLDAEVHDQDPRENIRSGLGLVPQGGRVFPDLSVEENLRVAAGRTTGSALKAKLAEVHRLFPPVEERAQQTARSLSGGEKQMLAVGMGLMPAPRLLMVDEPSIGLAPSLQDDLFNSLEGINRDANTTILIVEQDVQRALQLAQYAYVLQGGRITHEGPADEIDPGSLMGELVETTDGSPEREGAEDDRGLDDVDHGE